MKSIKFMLIAFTGFTVMMNLLQDFSCLNKEAKEEYISTNKEREYSDMLNDHSQNK